MTNSAPRKDDDIHKQDIRISHLIPALLALVILICGSLYIDRSAITLENEYIHSLATQLVPQDNAGLVVQQAALRQPDVLPVYGSSEMLSERTFYRAFIFFSSYPTGFAVMDVARSGDTTLNMAQNIGALGPALRGKKVVISFTPSMFNFPQAKEDAYDSDFSRAHALAFVFNPQLSLQTRQLAAQRMVVYPATLVSDPVLRFTVQNLAAGAWYNDAMVAFATPLGDLENFVIRMQDHFAIWKYLRAHTNLKPQVLRRPRAINWQNEIALAQKEQEALTNTNVYGIENLAWQQSFNSRLEIAPPGSGDQEYIANLEKSKEWGDLAILCQVLQEMGAEPLILSRPVNGTLFLAHGISPQAQQIFYTKLDATVQPYHFSLVDFQEYTNDRYFSTDMASHSSHKGWALVDQALDTFFHSPVGK